MAGRREFVAGLLAAAIAPRALAQPRDAMKVVGYLSGGQGPEWLVKALVPLGYVDGRNLRVETRTPADWETATLAKAAAELVALKPDALVALHGNRVGALAQATKTIPIVCAGMPDPVGAGFAKTLRRPGGNVTGLSFGLPEVAEISFGMLKALRPRLTRAGVLAPPGSPAIAQVGFMQAAARKAGVEWIVVQIHSDADVEAALGKLAGSAVVVAPLKDTDLGKRALETATRMNIITVGSTQDGALMNYGLDHQDAQGRIAAILDKVLKGANPAEIPFELPDRPAFSWNRTTARALKIEAPQDILLRVTEFVD